MVVWCAVVMDPEIDGGVSYIFRGVIWGGNKLNYGAASLYIYIHILCI